MPPPSLSAVLRQVRKLVEIEALDVSRGLDSFEQCSHVCPLPATCDGEPSPDMDAGLKEKAPARPGTPLPGFVNLQYKSHADLMALNLHTFARLGWVHWPAGVVEDIGRAREILFTF